MNITLNIKKGLDLKIAGAPKGNPIKAKRVNPERVAIVPDDFPGLSLKPCVKPGDKVVAGGAVMIDKNCPDLALITPTGGIVEEVNRGERRKLMYISIIPDKNDETVKFDASEVISAEDAAKLLMKSGLWAMIRQRPYDIVPHPGSVPRDIYVSCMDTAPLAGDFDELLASKAKELEAGVKFLSKLTQGEIYITRKEGSQIPDIAGASMITICGQHPAGNVGVAIANTKPVNKGETVWTMDGFTLARIGTMAQTGEIDFSTTVAITGSEVENPGYVITLPGADIKSLVNGNIKQTEGHKRYISGNVLTGQNVGLDGFLRAPYRQVTVIPEGDDVTEFMGWASLSPKKMSTSRSFPGHFLLKKLFKPDARLLGGRRAMIMSGEYDKVVPMDIMTEYLIKAILSRNIEQMEALGIYEIAPEDVSVAEYVCTSKMPLQAIVREGLDYLRKELE